MRVQVERTYLGKQDVGILSVTLVDRILVSANATQALVAILISTWPLSLSIVSSDEIHLGRCHTAHTNKR